MALRLRRERPACGIASHNPDCRTRRDRELFRRAAAGMLTMYMTENSLPNILGQCLSHRKSPPHAEVNHDPPSMGIPIRLLRTVH